MSRLLRRTGAAVTALLAAAILIFAGVYYEPDPGPDAPRVLVSVDRTLWNSLGLNRFTYVRQLRRAGLSPVLVQFTEDGSLPADVLESPAVGLVLTGGGDVAAARYDGDAAVTRDVKPARDAFELALLEEAWDRSLPVLGLCRGAQLMNVWLGGTLGDFRHDAKRYSTHHTATGGHDVRFEAGSELARIYGSTVIHDVTTWHGQHVDLPGRGVEIVGYSPDGVPEAFEVRDAPFAIGVQWHAEMPPWDEQQNALFDAYAAAVRSVQAATK